MNIKKIAISTLFVVTLSFSTVLGAIPLTVYTPAGYVSTEVQTAEATVRNTANNRLRNLTVPTNGATFTQSFAPNRDGYVINVRENIGRINVRPTRDNNHQSIRHRLENRRPNGTWQNEGWSSWRTGGAAGNQIPANIAQGQERRIRIQVRDRAGNIRAYSVWLRRASPNTFAQGLSVSHGTLNRSFNRSTATYNLTLPANRASVNIGMSRGHGNQTLRTQVDNATWSGWQRNNISRNININPGQTRTIRFQFRGAFSEFASSPTRVRTYAVTITRPRVNHTVSFNSHGGSAVNARTVQSGLRVGALPTPTRAGHTFNGWHIGSQQGARANENTVISGNTVLHARWTVNPVVQRTVTFNSHGGSAVGNRTVNNNAAIGALPTPTRANHTFMGWFTQQTGGTQINANTVVTANMTLHARWQSSWPATGTMQIGPAEIMYGNAQRGQNLPPGFRMIDVLATFCVHCTHNGSAPVIFSASYHGNPTVPGSANHRATGGYMAQQGTTNLLFRPGGTAWSSAEIGNHQLAHVRGAIAGPDNFAQANMVIIVDSNNNKVAWWHMFNQANQWGPTGNAPNNRTFTLSW